MELLNNVLVGVLPLVPKSIVGKIGSRYIAGESKIEAMNVVRKLNAQGFMATMDILGEFVTSEAKARETADEYVDLLRSIHELGLDANVSVKLTQLGLILNLDLCRELIHEVVGEAHRLNNFVRLDMEDSSGTQDTLDLYKHLRTTFPRVGCVIQSYLRRSEADLPGIVAINGNVRLCKGIYVEPENIAFKDPLEVNRSFESLLEVLLSQNVYTGIATHDERLVQAAYRLIDEHGCAPKEYEFQMLLGVTETLRQEIVDRGHRLRVYVPYGSQWYEYSVRRLKENPKLAGYALKGFLTRGR